MREAAEWFCSVVFDKVRERYIAIPIGHKKVSTKNSTFVNFESWHQSKSYCTKLRRQYKEKYKVYLVNRPGNQDNYCYFPIESLVKAVELDLKWCYCWFGGTLLKQTLGIPQGSPLSVWAANCCALYLEVQNKCLITDALSKRFGSFSLVRKRWVDDLFCLIRVETEISDLENEELFQAISKGYQPFALKREDDSVFVGLNVKTSEVAGFRTTTFNSHIKSARVHPIAPNIKGNYSNSKIKGMIKGSLMRLLDSASDEGGFKDSIEEFLKHISQLGYKNDLIRQVLFDLGTYYSIFSKVHFNLIK